MHRSISDGELPPTDPNRDSAVFGAVLTAFRPGPELVTAVTAAASQVATVVVVVDEHPISAPTRAILEQCRAVGADVVEHDTNRGIGAALNTGVAWLRSRPGEPVTHVLTLDQDSGVPPGYVNALAATADRATDQGVPVGMVAPDSVGTIIRLWPRSAERSSDDGGVVVGGEPIQSGLWVPMTVLTAVDGFDESLFIDGVDTDFFLRAADHGLRCIISPGTRLEHRLGTAITTAGRELPLVVAADFRYFYQWRNLVLLVRRHAVRHPAWAVTAVVRSLRHLLIVSVLSTGRRRRLSHAASGLRAGLRGERGKAAA